MTCIRAPGCTWTTLSAATGADVAAEREKYKGAYIFGKVARRGALATQL